MGAVHNNWKNPRQSIGMKMFVITFNSVVVLVSAIGIMSYLLSKQIIQDEVADAQQQTINMATDKLDSLLSGYVGLTRQILVDKDLQAQFKQVSGSTLGIYEKMAVERDIRGKLDSIRASNPAITALRLVPKTMIKERIVSTTGASSVEMNDSIKSGLNQILQADGEPVYLPTMQKGLFGYSSEPTFNVGRLLKNMNQRDAEYIIIMEFPMQLLTDTFSKLTFGEEGALTIVTDKGSIVYRSALTDESEIGSVRESYTANQLVVTQHSSVTGWELEGSVMLSELLRRTDTILYVTVAMVIVAAAAAAMIGYILLRIVARPIVRMCGLMEQAEEGDLTVHAEVKGKDEIARLGRSFNRMLERIGGSLIVRTYPSFD
jgi:methyl-accepting chemotaxis protein